MKEKLQKENTALEQEYKKFSVSLRDEFGGLKNEKVADYERRIIELEEKLQVTKRKNNNDLLNIALNLNMILLILNSR